MWAELIRLRAVIFSRRFIRRKLKPCCWLIIGAHKWYFDKQIACLIGPLLTWLCHLLPTWAMSSSVAMTDYSTIPLTIASDPTHWQNIPSCAKTLPVQFWSCLHCAITGHDVVVGLTISLCCVCLQKSTVHITMSHEYKPWLRCRIVRRAISLLYPQNKSQEQCSNNSRHTMGKIPSN